MKTTAPYSGSRRGLTSATGGIRTVALVAVALALVAACDLHWPSFFTPSSVTVGSQARLVNDFHFNGSLEDELGSGGVLYESASAVFVADTTGGQALALEVTDPANGTPLVVSDSRYYVAQLELSGVSSGFSVALWVEPQFAVSDLLSDASSTGSLDTDLLLSSAPVNVETATPDQFGAYAPRPETSGTPLVRIFAGLSYWDDGGVPVVRFATSAELAGTGTGGSTDDVPADDITPYHVVVTVDDAGKGSAYLNGRAGDPTHSFNADVGADRLYLTIVLSLTDTGGLSFETGPSGLRLLQLQLYEEALREAEVRELHERGAQ